MSRKHFNPVGICLWCNELFERENGHQKYCSTKCVRAAKNERNKRWMSDKRIKRNQLTNHSLDDTLRELTKYNEEHGTHLSYGQYMLMKNNK